MIGDYIKVGDCFKTAKTVSETDVYLMAGITGDFHAVHVNEEYMEKNHYGKRIAHGVLSLALTSTTAGIAADAVPMLSVAYGYDKVRFLKPVFFGDTLTTKYTYMTIDEDKMKTTAKVEVTNQRGELVMVAEHILKFFEENADE